MARQVETSSRGAAAPSARRTAATELPFSSARAADVVGGAWVTGMEAPAEGPDLEAGPVGGQASGGAPDAGAPSVDPTGTAAEVAPGGAAPTPEQRVAALYAAHGESDAFLLAIYAEPTLVDAALARAAPDRSLEFFGAGGVSGAVAAHMPGVAGARLDPLLDGATRGAGMSAAARIGLRRLAQQMPTAQAFKAFRARFNHEIRDVTGAWTMANLLAVWDQLEVLPDTDVSSNTVLTTFDAIVGGGAFGPSWESPSMVNTIQIGEDNTPANLAHTVRHEVGHAVHAQIPGQINPWLEGEIGFWYYEGNAGLRRWIEELGGFPTEYAKADGSKAPVAAAEQDRAIAMVASFLGGGASWNPTRPTVEDAQTPEDAALWAAMPTAVRDAITNSPGHWYTNHATWQTGARGRYFLNYWYGRPFWMSARAQAVVAATGDNYTAMSEKEFFANVYAEYFEDPAGYADHTRWGGSLPADVQQFFAKHVVERQPYAPPAGAAPTPGAAPPPAPSGMPGTP